MILSRVLFATCMVFILGYVFGSFSKNATLTTITKIASVLAIVLYMTGSVFSFRNAGWRNAANGKYQCEYFKSDSILIEPPPAR